MLRRKNEKDSLLAKLTWFHFCLLPSNSEPMHTLHTQESRAILCIYTQNSKRINKVE